jgi:tRNA wybutosine-synthesizing protein 3
LYDISLWVSSRKEANDGSGKIGGEGDSGKWLYVTHDPDDIDQSSWWAKVKTYQEEEQDGVE